MDGELYDLMKVSSIIIRREVEGSLTQSNVMRQTMDSYVADQAAWGINRTRREFMSGKEHRFSGKFWMQSPMFLPVAGSAKPPPPPNLHPWVIAADRASYSYRANPRPPIVYGRKDGEPVPISECQPDHICPGDVVAVTFTVAYILTEREWYPQYQPVEIYVLKQSLYEDPFDYDAIPGSRTPPLTMGISVVEGASKVAGSDAEKTY